MHGALTDILMYSLFLSSHCSLPLFSFLSPFLSFLLLPSLTLLLSFLSPPPFFRPQVALLCGAPGLGKTTLAHIIAKHAGYNVVEMNAR